MRSRAALHPRTSPGRPHRRLRTPSRQRLRTRFTRRRSRRRQIDARRISRPRKSSHPDTICSGSLSACRLGCWWSSSSRSASRAWWARGRTSLPTTATCRRPCCANSPKRTAVPSAACHGGILKVAGRVFKFARRRMGWHGDNPVSDLENGERPKPNPRRRIYQGDELAQTLGAAHEPYKALFALAAVTGARESECLGLTWDDVDLADPDTAEIRVVYQVDTRG